MWEKISGGKTVGNSWFGINDESCNPELMQLRTMKFHVEARHGQAFQGLLKRFFTNK